MIFTSGLPLAVHSRVAESYWLTITDLEGQGEYHMGMVDRTGALKIMAMPFSNCNLSYLD